MALGLYIQNYCQLISTEAVMKIYLGLYCKNCCQLVVSEASNHGGNKENGARSLD